MSQPASKATVFAASRLNPLVQHRLVWIVMVLAVAWLPVILGLHSLETVAKLFPLAETTNPYFVSAYALTLYVWTPLVVMSACILLLSPGLLLAMAFNLASSVERWLLHGFALSLIVISLVTAFVQSIAGVPIVGYAFILVVAGCALPGAGLLLVRALGKNELAWPLAAPNSTMTLGAMVMVPALLLLSLSPKFYWENFNGDGAHAFEAARLLLVQPLPFWPETAGEIAGFPGMTSLLYAFPTAWFIRLFGPYEISARLPLLLYLAPLYGVMVLLIEHQRAALLTRLEKWLIWLPIIIYVLAMAYSATYNPYSADIALPATQDTLLIICFLGFILAFIERTWLWLGLYAALTYMSLPNGLLLLGFWLVAVAFTWRPFPKKQLLWGAGMVASCFVMAALAPRLLEFFNLPLPGSEYGVVGLLRRFAFLQFTDWTRLAFLVVPCGILPALALLAWPWQDQVARALTIVTLLYFGFFFVQAHVVLHHFVPVMLLPVIVFWRNGLVVQPHYRPAMLGAVAVFGVVALWLSWPANARPHTSARLVGAAVLDRTGGYEANDPTTFRRAEILNELFPYDWHPDVPFETYGGSPLVWNYYAHQPKPAGQDINYVIQFRVDPAPAGMQKVAEAGDVALYVNSPTVWAEHKAIRPATPAGSPTYQLPRGIIFRSVPLENGPTIINVVDLIEAVGFNMGPVLDRLGVER